MGKWGLEDVDSSSKSKFDPSSSRKQLHTGLLWPMKVSNTVKGTFCFPAYETMSVSAPLGPCLFSLEIETGPHQVCPRNLYSVWKFLKRAYCARAGSWGRWRFWAQGQGRHGPRLWSTWEFFAYGGAASFAVLDGCVGSTSVCFPKPIGVYIWDFFISRDPGVSHDKLHC